MMASVLLPPTGVSYMAARARNDGLFSNFMTVIGVLHEAEEEGLTPVVKFDYGLYLDPAVGPNWWEYYFEPVSNLAADDVCIENVDLWKMGGLAGAPWHLGLSRASELAAKYIRPRRDIVEEVDRFFERHLKDVYVVGIHLRGTDKHTETGERLPDATVLRAIDDAACQTSRAL